MGDRNDAEAIATAARQGNMRFVPVKSVDQQARLSWLRASDDFETEGFAIGDRIRGLLAEFDVVITPSDAGLRRWLAVPSELVEFIRDLAAHRASCTRNQASG